MMRQGCWKNRMPDIRSAKTKCKHTKKAYMKAFKKELTKKLFVDA